MIAVAAKTMPSVRPSAGQPTIDYAGIAAISVVAGGLTLATSLGGTAVRLDVAVHHRAVRGRASSASSRSSSPSVGPKEPMLPLRLFTSAVFSLSSVIALVVGFAMLGAMTFLPTYLQYVHGVSATSSGLRTLPMVVGLLAASITAGTIVGRTGRYKIFPIAGSVLMTVGLLLMSTMDAHTGFLRISPFMFVLGVGIGLCMQILTIIVQNTSDYRDLGVATSGVTFFRALGSSFGAAVFGAIYSGQAGERAAGRRSPRPGSHRRTRPPHRRPCTATRPPSSRRWSTPTPTSCTRSSCTPPRSASSRSCSACSCRRCRCATPPGPAPATSARGSAMAEGADSDRALEIQLARLMQREGRRALPAIRIASGTALGGAETWCVAQVLLRERHGVSADLDSIAAADERAGQRAAARLPADRRTPDTSPATPAAGRPRRWPARSGRCSARR